MSNGKKIKLGGKYRYGYPKRDNHNPSIGFINIIDVIGPNHFVGKYEVYSTEYFFDDMGECLGYRGGNTSIDWSLIIPEEELKIEYKRIADGKVDDNWSTDLDVVGRVSGECQYLVRKGGNNLTLKVVNGFTLYKAQTGRKNIF